MRYIFPRTRLVCLENTHNLCDGAPLTAEYTAALNCDVRDLVREVDSVMFCLSKGLCAPVGSVLCGSADFIYEARRARKVVGGGMRQAGILAAAGIVALEQMTGRLAEDHARARRLAEGLAQIPGVQVGPVYTNIFYFWLTEDVPLSPEVFLGRLWEQEGAGAGAGGRSLPRRHPLLDHRRGCGGGAARGEGSAVFIRAERAS